MNARQLWERFKRSCGPMSDEEREAWKPMKWACYYVGALKIVGAVIALTVTHSW